jgi:hypothetical protein
MVERRRRESHAGKPTANEIMGNLYISGRRGNKQGVEFAKD